MDLVKLLGLESLEAEVKSKGGALVPPRPMLAVSLLGNAGEDYLDQLRYPVYASFKLDGYRALMFGGYAWARSGKEHKAPCVRRLARLLAGFKYPGALDGELMVPGLGFNEAGGLLRREDYQGDFEFVIYDLALDGVNFRSRLGILQSLGSQIQEAVRSGEAPWGTLNPEERSLLASVKFLKHYWIENKEQLLGCEKGALELGYEGLCTRAPYGDYKHTRGTLKDQLLCKLKRWKNGEALVLGLEPRMENQEEGETNAWGLTERGKKKEFLVETDLLGRFNVVGLGHWKGVEFSVGSFLGLDDTDKRRLWAEPLASMGKVISFKYLPLGGKDKPRHPVFLGFRPWEDLDPALQAEVLETRANAKYGLKQEENKDE